MDFTGQKREFTPDGDFISQAHRRWAKWCQSRAGSPPDFRRFLERAGMHVDPKTAASWFFGETLPSTARIIQLNLMGAKRIFEVIFEPSLLAADLNIRRSRIAQMRAELEREEYDLRQMGHRHVGLDIREDGQSSDVGGQASKAPGIVDARPLKLRGSDDRG